MPRMTHPISGGVREVPDRGVRLAQRSGWVLADDDATAATTPDPAALAEAARLLTEMAEQKNTEAGTDSATSKEN